jgi:hypothetical protein
LDFSITCNNFVRKRIGVLEIVEDFVYEDKMNVVSIPGGDNTFE